MKRSVRFGVVVALALLSAGCSHVSASHDEQVEQWVNGAGYPALQAQIDDDLADIGQADRAHALPELQTDCDGFPADVSPAYTTLPTPDGALTNDLNAEYEAYFEAAQDCSQASGFSSAKYAAFVRELAKGNHFDALAKARLSTLSVR